MINNNIEKGIAVPFLSFVIGNFVQKTTEIDMSILLI